MIQAGGGSRLSARAKTLAELTPAGREGGPRWRVARYPSRL
ncbi:hypothetical protein [Escherichia coli]